MNEKYERKISDRREKNGDFSAENLSGREENARVCELENGSKRGGSP